jgi:soluble lytic murein transglycosylase-like protein
VGKVKVLLILAGLSWAAPVSADPVERWGAEISEASARFGIPEEWIRRVMRIESGGVASLDGRPVVSSAGAIGLMQLMPGTWREMRDLLSLGADAADPHDNILAGTAYLKAMYDRFGYPGLFAAYNAGPERYAAYLSGQRPLPAETRLYIARAAAAAMRDQRLSLSTSPPPHSVRAERSALFAGSLSTSSLAASRAESGAGERALFVTLGDAAQGAARR